MLSNKLYEYIKDELPNIKPNSHLLVPQLKFKTSSDEKNYLLYDLPPSIQIINLENQEYILKSHHISIYEMENDNISVLSQYHYTAYFHDNNNQTYQLHVYFNRKDQVVNSIFSLNNQGEENQILNINEESITLLNQIAIDHCFHFIGELRQQYGDKINSLVITANQLEQKMTSLSVDLLKNIKQYKATLNEMIAVLTCLNNYDYNNQYFILLKLFRQIKNSLFLRASTVETQENAPDETPLIIDNAPQTNSLNENLTPLVENQVALHLERVQEAKNSFFLSKDKKIELFLNFDQLVSDSIPFTIERDSSLTTEQLSIITAHLSIRNNEGKKLLTNLLLDGQFQTAALLKNYASQLSEKLIILALKKGNALLLDFLLTHREFPINTLLVEDGLTPVLYCYRKHSEKIPMVDCLSILIKHNASVMVKIKGLPLAHYLLNELNPLNYALINQSDKTIGNPKFFKEVISHLESFCKHCPDAESQSILAICIEDYNHRLNRLSKNSLERQHSVISTNAAIRNNLNLTPLEKIKNDPDYQSKVSSLITSLNEHYNQMSKHDQGKSAVLTSEGAQMFEKILGSIDFSQPNSKKLIHDKLDMWIKMMPFAVTFNQLQTRLQNEKKPGAKTRIKSLIQQTIVNLEKAIPNYQSLFNDELLQSLPSISNVKKENESQSRSKPTKQSEENNSAAELATIHGFLPSPRENVNNDNSIGNQSLPNNNINRFNSVI